MTRLRAIAQRYMENDIDDTFLFSVRYHLASTSQAGFWA
jgi:hypothetical protein